MRPVSVHPADLANIVRHRRGDFEEYVKEGSSDPRNPEQARRFEEAIVAAEGDLSLATALIESEEQNNERATNEGMPEPPVVKDRPRFPIPSREPARALEAIEVIMLDGTRVVSLGGRTFKLTETEMQKVLAIAVRAYERDIAHEIKLLREAKLAKRRVASKKPSTEASA